MIYSILKKIFIPSFCYEFNTSLVELAYTENLVQKLNALGAYNIVKLNDGYKFAIPTSRLLNRFRIGKSQVTVHHENEYIIHIKFETQQKVHFIMTLIFSVLFVICILISQETLLYKIAAIAAIPLLIFIEGHLALWQLLAMNMQKIKKFFYDLGE